MEGGRIAVDYYGVVVLGHRDWPGEAWDWLVMPSWHVCVFGFGSRHVLSLVNTDD